MTGYLLTHNNELLNSANQVAGRINSAGKVTDPFGIPSTNYLSGGVIRDGYYNVVGIVNQAPAPIKMMQHP